MFSRKKPPNTQNVIGSTVAAELQPISSFPDLPPGQVAPGMMCKKLRVDGSPPNASFSEDTQVQTPETGYVVSNIDNHAPFVIANTADFNFKVWNLKSDDDLRFAEEVQFSNIHPDQDSWVGFYVLDISCLSSNRVLLAVAYYDPRIKYALYLYDVDSSTFKHLADTEADIRNPYKFFDHKRLNSESSLVLYYSGRTRRAAELYYNEFNHFMLFTPQHRNGLDVLKLSIETGNVVDWTVDKQTLFMRTLDGRAADESIETLWSLDMSRVLPE